MNFSFHATFFEKLRLLSRILVVFLCLASPVSNSFAEPAAEPEPEANKENVIELPNELPPLPGAGDAQKPLYLTSRNAALFHEVLLAPVASWIESGKFVVRVVQSLNTPFTLDGAGCDGALEGQNLKFPAGIGRPFCDLSKIRDEKDQAKKGAMILWNVLLNGSEAKDLLYRFEMAWVNAQAPYRRMGGVLYREYRAAPEPGFQELFHLLAPAVVSGYTQIMFRGYGPAEDSLWMYSPVIGKSRKVLASNRSDTIIDGQFTPDDLLVWSTDPRTTNIHLVDEKILLVPFAAPDAIRVSSPGQSPRAATEQGAVPVEQPMPKKDHLLFQGHLRRSDGQPAFVTWNYENGLFAQAPRWIPTSALFVPRKVWILEVSTTDPYYQLGREILVVDQLTSLPVYRIKYDRRGIYLGTILGGWALAQNTAEKLTLPVLGWMVFLDRAVSSGMIFSTLSVETTQGKSEHGQEEYHRLLDIKAHGNQAGPADSKGAGAPEDAETEVDSEGAVD